MRWMFRYNLTIGNSTWLCCSRSNLSAQWLHRVAHSRALPNGRFLGCTDDFLLQAKERRLDSRRWTSNGTKTSIIISSVLWGYTPIRFGNKELHSFLYLLCWWHPATKYQIRWWLNPSLSCCWRWSKPVFYFNGGGGCKPNITKRRLKSHII